MAFRVVHNDGRRGRLRSYESLAGWVFADLLLVLFLVGLGTAIPLDPPKPLEPEIIPAPEVFPERDAIIGMETDPVSLRFTVDADGLSAGDRSAQNRTRDLVRSASRALASDGQEGALVLIFGGGESASVGQRVAETVYPQLHRAAQNVFPQSMGRRFFWDGSLPYGSVRLEVFVFATEASSSRP